MSSHTPPARRLSEIDGERYRNEGRALFGEVTEARFRALAGAMGGEAKVINAG